MLRRASEDDAVTVAEIYIDSWNEGFGDLLGFRDHTGELVERWSQDLVDASADWFVAEDDDEVVGFVGLGPSRDPLDDGLGELHAIHVSPDHWRRGIGAELIGHAVEQLRSRWERAILWTPSNYERGHEFYGAMGWTRLDLTRRNGGEVAFGRRFV